MMKSVANLDVYLETGIARRKVGELVISGIKIYFRYDAEFRISGIELSPFKLPLSGEMASAKYDPFEGLFGLFNDSLPDGWGRMLLDRKLKGDGVNLNIVTPLDRLAAVGERGTGALVYVPSIFQKEDFIEYELDLVSREIRKLTDGFESDILDDLFHMGGSSGGARPKISVAYDRDADHLMTDMSDYPDTYEPWIIKFPSSIDLPDIANIEYAYYKMALDAGIEMSESRLFQSASGLMFFGTKRFDRQGRRRIHMHSASGLLHDNYRLSTMDYGHLMDCAFRLENHVGAYLKILRLAAFNVFAHNRDDHSKNFAFLMEDDGSWHFAPAYDLTFSRSTHGYHSTTVDGEGENPGDKQLLSLGKQFGLKGVERVLDEVRSVISNWDEYAKDAGVSGGTRRMISKELI